jgi:hypothetical protein
VAFRPDRGRSWTRLVLALMPRGALERPGARGYETRVIAAHDSAPWLAVRNPQTARLSEKVMAQADWFWWPWADRIAPTAAAGQAANRVALVLRADSRGQ